MLAILEKFGFPIHVIHLNSTSSTALPLHLERVNGQSRLAKW